MTPQASKPELEQKSAELDQRLDAYKKGEEMYMAIRLDTLRKILDDLDADPELRQIFGGDVTGKLGLISMRNDIKISELKMTDLSDADAKKFLHNLRTILRKNLTKGGG